MQKTLLRNFLLVAIWCSTSICLLSAKDFDVVKYGALPDTTFNSTEAFQQAIDQCYKSGGGRVVVPAGQFLIGSVFLRSDVELHLAHGAVVYGSARLEDYRPVKPEFKSLRTNEETIQLIYAEKASNIALTGSGTLDGQGAFFERNFANDEGIGRPHLIRFIECEAVRVENLTLRNSGCWMQHYLACSEVLISGLKIYNHSNYNNDGIDIDGCKNVVITGCIIDSDDDGIVLKSTSSRLSENVLISNCIVSSHCNAIKLGTESNGGFKNISISTCIIKPSAMDTSLFYGKYRGISGISLEMVDGGVLSDVNVIGIMIDSVEVPLFVRLGKRNRPYKEGQQIINDGILKNVFISDVHAENAGRTGCSISGYPGAKPTNIRLANVSIAFEGGEAVTSDGVTDWMRHLTRYPEATMFGDLPAYGFYIRDVNGISMDNIAISYNGKENRPPVILQDVKDAMLTGSRLRVQKDLPAALVFNNVKNVTVLATSLVGHVPFLLDISGDDTRSIYLDGILPQSTDPFLLNGVSESEVRILR